MLFHVVPGPVSERFSRIGISWRKLRSPRRWCVVFPEGHVDQGETASGVHGGAIMALMTCFVSSAIRMMLLRLMSEQPLQREAVTISRKEMEGCRLSLRLRGTCQLRAVADYEKSKRIDEILLLFISNNVRNFRMINLVEWQCFSHIHCTKSLQNFQHSLYFVSCIILYGVFNLLRMSLQWRRLKVLPKVGCFHSTSGKYLLLRSDGSASRKRQAEFGQSIN